MTSATSRFIRLYGNACRRLITADGLARNADPRAALVVGAAAAATPGMLLAFYLLPMTGSIDLTPLLGIFAAFSCLLVALLTLLEWDALFPGAVDAAVLLPLPLPPRLIFAAQAAALATLLGVLLVAVNGCTTILFPVFGAAPGQVFGLMGRQAASVALGGTLAFCSVLCVQGLLLCLTGYGGLRRIGPFLQLAGLVLVLAGLLLTPSLLGFAGKWLRVWMAPGPLLRVVLVVAPFTLVLYAAAYRRFVRQAAAGPPQPRPTQAAMGWSRIGQPRTAAVARFVAATLGRNRRHRLIVAGWFALGAAVVVESGVDLLVRPGRRSPSLAEIQHAALGLPLVLTLFLLAGLRASFNTPAELEANWIFRLLQGDSAADLVAGARRVLYVYFGAMLLPAALLATWIDGWRAATRELLFIAASGAVWIQILTQRLEKIPFTCSYQPGGAALKTRWPAYWLGFVIAAYGLASWEQALLGRPALFAVVLGAAGILLALAERSRRREWRIHPAARFEDESEPVVQTLMTY